MSRSLSISCASLASVSSSRVARPCWWRSVSTTSMASMTSSRGAADRAVTSLIIAARPCPPVPSVLALKQQCIALGGQSRQPALAIFHCVADFLGILGRSHAHLVDDGAALLLEVDHGIHQLLDRIGAYGWAITGTHGLLGHLVADFGKGFEALAHPFLHRIQRGGGLVQTKHAGKRG